MRQPIAERHPPQVMRYGPGARHVIDFSPAPMTARSSSLFTAATGRRSTGSSSSHLAAGLNALGIGVAIPSYDLCPDVSV